ncbi:hypothetical protein [Gellertiella hungarica]|uniref:Uncharacterized protein n=1 Tax=Gellertiella hungarica TaxID=1572859 RepID=A0A7W6NMH9_9HYPH|nr:hypothetical protein [Gellertiella hungarica]MBB4066397.1 hypothetical protein [Gellertiella hungarica]
MTVITGALVVTGAALLSILFSGYVPFFNNNIYHLPILRADYDLPAFADDTFVQSLRHFSSGFWMVFAGSATLVPPKLFLLGAFLLSRMLMMAAALHLAASFGYRGLRFSVLYLALLAATPLMRGYAPGGGGLDIDYFSHSELANATLLLSLSLAIRGGVAASLLLACITFFLNAFMAVWLAPVLIAVMLTRLAEGEIRLKTLAVRGSIGAVAGLPFVLPVVAAILHARDDAPSGYSYAAYLRGFFPFHFFLDSLSAGELAAIGLLALAGLFAALSLGKGGRPLAAAVLAAILLLAVGSALPLVTENRMILNLHFIRSAVLIQLLAVLGMAMIAAGLATDGRASAPRTVGLLLTALLILGKPGLPAALLVLAYLGWFRHRRPLALLDRPAAPKIAGYLALLAAAYAVPSALIPGLRDMQARIAISDRWERIGAWVARETPSRSLLLLPVGTERPATGADPAAQALAYDVTGFFATAGRPVWTNYKFGATPMWSPSTHAVWRERYDAVRALKDGPERLAYAARHGISHVITFCNPAITAAPIHRDGELCIYEVTKAGDS